MQWFDVGVGLALLLGGVWSFFRGLTREILSIVGLIAAFELAMRGYPAAAKHLETFIASPGIRYLVGFGGIFLATMVLYVLFAALLHRLVTVVGLSVVDRLLGGLFGFIKVGVMVSALLLVTAQFFPTFTTRLTADSTLAPTFFQAAHILTTLLPARTSNRFRQVYRHLQQRLSTWQPTPRRPAAGPPLSSPQAEGISERDAQQLEKLLRKRLQEP